MTNTQLQTIRRAISLLSALIDEPTECAPVARQSPVRRFVQDYLMLDSKCDLTSAEAWTFFLEVVQARELKPIRRAVFLRLLPTVVEAVYGLRKSHHVERSGRRVRGFKGVTIRGSE